MKYALAMLMGTTLLVGGCSTMLFNAPTASDGTVTLGVTTRVQESGYRAQGADPYEAPAPYKKADIDHVTLQLFRLDAQGNEPATPGAELKVVQASLSVPIDFTRLRANAKYVLKAAAYKGADDVAGDLISLPATAGIDVGTSLAHNVAITIRLKDTPFSGAGTASLAITDGEYTSPAAESIQ